MQADGYDADVLLASFGHEPDVNRSNSCCSKVAETALAAVVKEKQGVYA